MQKSTAPEASASRPALEHLARLIVLEEVRALKAKYLRLLDTQQWDDLATLFTEDAHFTLATAGEPVVFDKTGDWIDNLKRTLAGGTTVHQVHQGEIDVTDNNTASALWAMTDYVILSSDSGRLPFYGHGHYAEQYRRIDKSWKIVSLELTRLMLNDQAFAEPLRD